MNRAETLSEKTGAQDAPTKYNTLQELIWPEQGICTERDLYLRLNGRPAPELFVFHPDIID